ncbi:MAG: ribonuclease P [Zestosphaera sp.]
MRRRSLLRDLAVQRAMILYDTSVLMIHEGRPNIAREQVELGLRLLRKAGVRRPLPYRRYICRRCHVPLVPGLSARVRLRGNRRQVIITLKCLHCGWVMRQPCMRRK